MTPHNSPTNRLRSPIGRLLLMLVALIGLVALATPVAAQASAGERHQGANARDTNEADVRDFGARCDGVTNDRGAIDAALQSLAGTGGVLRIPQGDCQVGVTSSTVFMGIPSNVTIQGEGKSSTLTLSCDASTDYAELFRVSGENAGLRDLRLVHTGTCDTVMVAVHSIQGLAVQNVSIVGNAGQVPGYVHGVLLIGTEGPTSDLSFNHVTMRSVDYGLLQPSDVTQPVDGITIDDSRFVGNYADDLEFNAPEGLISNVTVTNSDFRNNKSKGEGSGFGVGLANVQHAVIASNSFLKYSFEPVHIEDRSSDILVQDNNFRKSFTSDRSYASHVFIVNASTDINVVGNVFDTGRNCNRIQAVFVNAGGSAFPNPSDVSVRGNVLLASKTASLSYHSGVPIELERNKVRQHSAGRGHC